MSTSTKNDILVDVINSMKKQKVDPEVVMPKDERTFTIPKALLKNRKEGDIITFKYLLEDGESAVLVPEVEADMSPKEEKDKLDLDVATVKATREAVKNGKKEAPKSKKELLIEAEQADTDSDVGEE